MQTFHVAARARVTRRAVLRTVSETRRSLVLAAIAALLTIGCGGSDSPTDPGTSPPPPPPPPPPPTVSSVTVTPASDTLAAVGDTARLIATARDASGNVMSATTFTWSSSNQAVATVNTAGLVTAVSAGNATITASAGTVSGAATILVLPPTTLAVGAWTGFTSQNNAIGFVVTSANRVTQLGVAIEVSTPFVICTAPFSASTIGVSLTASGFADSLTAGGLIGLSNRIPVSGSRVTASQVTGTVSGYSGTFTIFCGTSLSFGTGFLFGNITFETRPLIPAGTDLTFKLVTSGAAHSCGLTTTGTAWCWGENGSGQLGDASTIDKNVPTQIAGPFTFSTISAGNNHTCALTTAGAAYCWGNNTNGRLGDGTTTNRLVPTAVAGGLVFASIRAPSNTCALTTAGAAYCWGNNTNGSVGDGTNTHRNQPTAVVGGYTYASLGGGSSSTCGITTSGTTYCWGENGSGQLGDGTTTHRNQPVQVLGGLTFKFIGTGRASHTCGITTSDDLYCWGENKDGQIGDSTTTDRTQPVRVAGGQKFSFVSVAASFSTDHTCAVRTDGAAYCWGNDDYGRLGRGGVAGRSLTPSAVFGGVTFELVSAGGEHSCGLSRTGVTYCWGRNSSGQTGLGKFLGLANYPMALRPRYQ